MGGLDLLLGFLPVDLRHLEIEDGLDEGLSVRGRLEIGFSHGAANQFRHRSFPSPRQNAQLLEFVRVHQKLRAPGGRHLSPLSAHTDEHEYGNPRELGQLHCSEGLG
jgi:hypothetical protein